ncbi:MAG: MFS transporter [Lachnospiraceae bacterium]|nr:MFS transporter [Lachnospiraceae bacterium]
MKEKKERLFHKDFTLVVIGQIISLFGNAVLRYALPLYLLNQTHSAVLFGIVSACSFIPMIVLAPVGGIVADRVNKRNVMVILDFSTAALILLFMGLLQRVDLVVLLIVVLMILYGIQGAYQPTVQAAIPVLTEVDNLMPANAVINLVSSLANLIGPVLGGILFGFWGLRPILILSIICFICSAIMEIFIHIPFQRNKNQSNVFVMVKEDMRDSFQFIKRDNPIIGKVSIILAGINMIFSSLIIIGVPIIINEHLGFSQSTGNRLYGYAQGALAVGGLLGGVLAGVAGSKLKIQQSYRVILFCTTTLLPIGIAVFFPLPAMVSYSVIVISCVVMMAFSTVFSVQMMAYVQQITPPQLIGKVMALIMCFVMCAHPMGQALYGMLFEILAGQIYIIFLIAFLICIGLGLAAKRVFVRIG